MLKKILNNSYSLLLVPPLIFTVIYSYFKGTIHFYVFLPAILFWILTIVIFYLLSNYFTPIIRSNKNEKILINKIKVGLNISDKNWKSYNNEKKIELYNYFLKQEKIIQDEIKSRYKVDLDKKKLKETIENEWKELSLEERIVIINNYEIREEKANKRRKIRLEKELEKEKELVKKQELLKEEENLRKLEAEKKREEEESNRKKLELEKKLIIEREKKLELEKQKKIKSDNDYKNFIKKQMLENEHKKKLESEAIQELITEGRLSDNFSLQNKRESIPSYIKDAVWKRDKQSCVNCGSNKDIEFDHIIPVSKGGSNSINNIQLLCQKCNRTKSNKIV